jgi:membrane-associated phospholipid phosphatase
MRIRRITIVAATLMVANVAATLMVASTANAQSVGKMLQEDFENSARDIGAVWSSPFDASSRDWLLTAAAFGAFGLSMFADQSVSDWAIRNDSSAFFRALAPVRRGGKLFAGKYVIPPVAAVYVLGVALKNQDLRDFVTGCMASWGAQGALRKTLYLLVGRARPDTLPKDPQDWRIPSGGSWQMHSFPAGHFANVLACATHWNKRFRLGAAGPVVYALAGAVGVGRLADKAHWTSDTVLGGILGYAVGTEVGRRSLERNKQRLAGTGGGAALKLSPTPDGVVVNVSWTF